MYTIREHRKRNYYTYIKPSERGVTFIVSQHFAILMNSSGVIKLHRFQESFTVIIFEWKLKCVTHVNRHGRIFRYKTNYTWYIMLGFWKRVVRWFFLIFIESYVTKAGLWWGCFSYSFFVFVIIIIVDAIIEKTRINTYQERWNELYTWLLDIIEFKIIFWSLNYNDSFSSRCIIHYVITSILDRLKNSRKLHVLILYIVCINLQCKYNLCVCVCVSLR